MTGGDERPLPVLRALLALANRSGSDPGPDPGLVEDRRRAGERSPMSMRVVTRRGRGSLDVADVRLSESVAVRTYRAPGSWSGSTHVLVHGGCYWAGSVASYDPICRWYAREAGVQVVSVEYRRAPEHLYPAAVDDCYAALVWAAEQPGVDPARLSVGGISAGGGLAAAVALMARDRGGPALALQVLEIPMLDPAMTGASLDAYGVGFGLTRDEIAEGWDLYLPDAGRRREPYASPATADLAGLPPAAILVDGCDPLRDEGLAYADRLRAAGVEVRTYVAHGHVHGSHYLTRFLPSGRRAVAWTTAALRSVAA